MLQDQSDELAIISIRIERMNRLDSTEKNILAYIIEVGMPLQFCSQFGNQKLLKPR